MRVHYIVHDHFSCFWPQLRVSYQDELVEVVEVGVLDDGDDDGDDQPEGKVADVEEQRHLPDIWNLKSTLGYLVSQVPGHGDSPDVVEVIKKSELGFAY